MRKADTAKVMTILQATWPNHPWNDGSLGVYHTALEDLDYADVDMAVREAICDLKWAPSPAELRTIALDFEDIRIKTENPVIERLPDIQPVMLKETAR